MKHADIRLSMFEGYLDQLYELNTRNVDINTISPEAKVKYKHVQIFVMYIIAKELAHTDKIQQSPHNIKFGPNVSIDPRIWIKISQAFPSAIKTVYGPSDSNCINKLLDIDIPHLNVSTDTDRIPELYDSLPNDEKLKLHIITDEIKKKIGI